MNFRAQMYNNPDEYLARMASCRRYKWGDIELIADRRAAFGIIDHLDTV